MVIFHSYVSLPEGILRTRKRRLHCADPWSWISSQHKKINFNWGQCSFRCPETTKRRLSLVPSTTSIQSPRTCKRWNPQSRWSCPKLGHIGWTLGGHWVERVCWKLSVLNFDPSYSMGILLALEVLKLAVFQPALTRTATKAAPRLQISASGQLWAVQPQDIKKCRWPPAFRSSRWPNAHLSHPHFPTALLHLRHLSSKEFESFKNFHVLCTPLEVSTSFFPAEAIWDTFWTVVAPVALVLLCVAEPDCGKESIPFLTWHHHPRHD